ncbi:exodeoxyribonuclease III [Candidatus Uhrbacteria bacterium CG_4_9_14_3_um_filter_36_7]|uniref:Exodeoxyribonuclease III n=1 Tax=Candidatus Uhrbacteria bacterium CG_4_9_14_3_um_filter_36_7 TaxID=1975033 RepID=A0A2M7XIL5_9BACT|nr:MAG: exodeoxyribonuclease III [Candidatus Uhrbacteria bacterium CG_4_9_14_3_um_filter_36_7]
MSYKLIISWNVNGIRAMIKKNFLTWLLETNPEILCLQETKAHPDQLTHEILHPNGYFGIWNAAQKRGYSGVATLSKIKPLMEISHFGEDILDEEGRIILTEYKDFYLFNIYFPNGGRDEIRLAYKLRFYDRFFLLLKEYERKKKPIIFCGDVNTAHHSIDLSRSKENENISGFLPIERAWLDKITDYGYVDVFRHFYPDKKDQYTWWDMKTHARARNVGWRLDYFWVQEKFLSKIKDAFILSDVFGSDHCPVGIKIDAEL